MSRYHISVDQILHGETMEGKSTERMQFETLLDELTDAEIKILTATAQALLDARTDNGEKIEYGIRNAMNRWFMAFFFEKSLPAVCQIAAVPPL